MSDTWKIAIAIGIGMILVKAMPHIDRYLRQTPLQRCESSKHTDIFTAEYECRIELGMEPIEKPVRNQKKKETGTPETRAIMDRITGKYKSQKKVTLTPEAEAGNPNPDITTARGLLQDCNTTLSSPDSYPNFGDFMADWTAKNACHYYIGGFLDAHIVTASLIDTNSPLFCAPATGLTTEMVTAAFGSYLSQHPEFQDDSARVAMAASLKHFFSCD
jgi:hypothetical protein